MLSVAKREGNTLSPVIRDAWDSGELRTLTRRDPLRASGAHVSIIGHVTATELERRLEQNEIENGLMNRFLLVAARRSKRLPNGGEPEPVRLREAASTIGARIAEARQVCRIGRTSPAEELWCRLYDCMADDDSGDLAAAATARAEAQVLRLSVTYALLDGSGTVDVPHLEAAWSMWNYCAASAKWCFGDSIEDPVADRILTALVDSNGARLNRTLIRDLFNRHESAQRIETALDLLDRKGLIERETDNDTGGRPSEYVSLRRSDPSDQSAETPIGRLGRFERNALPTLEPAARHGLAGEVLEVLEPHTEADPAALLADFLASFGSAVGPHPHALADGAEHPARLFVLLVGETAKARKGTARANIRKLMELADKEWSDTCVVSASHPVKDSSPPSPMRRRRDGRERHRLGPLSV